MATPASVLPVPSRYFIKPMPSSSPAAPHDVSAWVGRTERVTDVISPNLAERMAVTLDQPVPAEGQALPLLWHWAFFQNPLPPAGLGTDGHPARGGFLPPADGRNRMWAGGEFEFRQPLRVGLAAERHTTIEAVDEKHGRTGALLFVTLRHDYWQADTLALRERQHIVFRAPSPPKTRDDAPVPAAQWTLPVQPDATLLFRYSAVTFNGHRIHYDHPYATAVEGYGGLVVHGPLLATLSVQAFCQAQPRAEVRGFRYRGVRPLVLPDAFAVAGRVVAAGQAETWVANAAGLSQQGQITFA